LSTEPTAPAPDAAAERRSLALLAACQALLFAHSSTVVAVNGLAGHALAGDKALATLPVTAWVAGAAVATVPASLFMRRWGRRAGFTLGALAGLAGAALCSWALVRRDFWLLCLGTAVFGIYHAVGQYYRYAAADAVAPSRRGRAIALVLAGGLAGGIVGPELSKRTLDLLPTLYLGSYLSLVIFLLPVLALVRRLELPAPAGADSESPGRPLGAVMAQPAFVVAATSGAVAYGVMNLLMTATPLAMGACGHAYGAAALVIQWHVIGMFAPSFVTGTLIDRLGVLRVMLAGVALLAACVGVGISGMSVAHFWLALVLLGVGWNFLYVGATNLVVAAVRPAERAKAQGANDLVIFLTQAASSFGAGLVLQRSGWDALNVLSTPFIAAAGAAVIWLMRATRQPAHVA
jgi:MFS family permease